MSLSIEKIKVIDHTCVDGGCEVHEKCLAHIQMHPNVLRDAESQQENSQGNEHQCYLQPTKNQPGNHELSLTLKYKISRVIN